MTDEMMTKLNQRLYLLEDGPSDPDAFVREATHEVMAKLDERLTLLESETDGDARTFAHPASPKRVEVAGSRNVVASTD